LAARAKARAQPWIKFVDPAYEHRTSDHENGVSGQLAIEIPLGGDRANVERYKNLVRKEDGEARGIVSQQALEDMHRFESQGADWFELLTLANHADEITERWWKARLAPPRDIGALLDESLMARNALIEARERAGAAHCTLMALSGVEPESWPRLNVQAAQPRCAD
jgi:hypothetical protein